MVREQFSEKVTFKLRSEYNKGIIKQKARGTERQTEWEMMSNQVHIYLDSFCLMMQTGARDGSFRDTCSQQPVCVNKVLLGHRHAHLLMGCVVYGRIHATMAELGSCD